MNVDPNPADWLSSPPAKPASRRRMKTIGLVAAGVVAGGVLAGTLGASAATSSTPTSPGSEGPSHSAPANAKSGAPVRGDEKAVSASISATLKQKALAKVPGSTAYRVETDAGDAAYEVHLTKSDGTEATVKFDKNLNITAVETGMGKGDPAPSGQGGMRHGPGGPGGAPGPGRPGGYGGTTTG